jgi:hypothetical protein
MLMLGIVIAIVLIIIIVVCIRIILVSVILLVAADTASLAPNAIAVIKHQSVKTVKLVFVK